MADSTAVGRERAKKIVESLRAGGAQVVASLPDSWLSPLIDAVEGDEHLRHVRVSREDDAVSVAAGAALMGSRSVVLCQNAGLMLATNVLAAYAHHHQIPMLLVTAARGGADDGYFYQVYKGQVSEKVAEATGLTVHRLSGPDDDWLFCQAQEQAWLQRRPVVLMCSRTALLGGAA